MCYRLLNWCKIHFLCDFRERYTKPTWETPIPDNYKLIDSDVDAFVKSILSVAMMTRFNKFCITNACQALQYLATMRSNLVISSRIRIRTNT